MKIYLLSLLVAISCFSQSYLSVSEGDYEIQVDTNSSSYRIFDAGRSFFDSHASWFSFIIPEYVFEDTFHSQTNLPLIQGCHYPSISYDSPIIDSLTNSIISRWFILTMSMTYGDDIDAYQTFSFTTDSMFKITFDVLHHTFTDIDPYDTIVDYSFDQGFTIRIGLTLNSGYFIEPYGTFINEEIPDTLIACDGPYLLFDFVNDEAFKPDTVFIDETYIEFVYTPRRIGHIIYGREFFSAIFRVGTRNRLWLEGEYPVYRGWNLLSNPLDDSLSIAEYLPFSDGLGYVLDSTGNWQFDTIPHFCEGYWFHSPIDTMIVFSAFSYLCPVEKVILTYPGWNLIGSLAYACELRERMFVYTAPVYCYNPVSGSCTEVDTLLPGRGYWIFNDRDEPALLWLVSLR